MQSIIQLPKGKDSRRRRLTHSAMKNDSPHDQNQMANRAEFGLPVSQPRPDRYSYLILRPYLGSYFLYLSLSWKSSISGWFHGCDPSVLTGGVSLPDAVPVTVYPGSSPILNPVYEPSIAKLNPSIVKLYLVKFSIRDTVSLSPIHLSHLEFSFFFFFFFFSFFFFFFFFFCNFFYIK